MFFYCVFMRFKLFFWIWMWNGVLVAFWSAKVKISYCISQLFKLIFFFGIWMWNGVFVEFVCSKLSIFLLYVLVIQAILWTWLWDSVPGDCISVKLIFLVSSMFTLSLRVSQGIVVVRLDNRGRLRSVEDLGF